MSSRHSERQRHSRDDYSRHSRHSYSDERSDDRVKRRRDRDKEYERRTASDNYKRSSRSGDKRSSSSKDSRSSKLAKSRSKADRTYNTDTEESDESCESPNRNIKRRLSSDYDEEVQDERLQLEGNGRGRDQNLSSKPTSKRSVSPFDSLQQCSRLLPSTDRGVDNERLKDVGPSLPLHQQKGTGGENSSERKEAQPTGPALPPHLQENCFEFSKDSCVAETAQVNIKKNDETSKHDLPYSGKTCVGPVLPSQHQRQASPDRSDDESESVGPTLSPHLRGGASSGYSGNERKSIGPVLHPHLEKTVSPSVSEGEHERASVGPVFPLHLKRNVSQDHSEDESSPPRLQRKPSSGSEDGTTSIGPVLPPHLRRKTSQDNAEDEHKSIGPVLPHNRQRRASSDHNGDESDHGEDDHESIGPILPHRLKRKSSSDEDKRKPIGPMLPPHLLGKVSSDHSDEDGSSKSIGPVLPPHLKGKNKDSQQDSDDSNDDSGSSGESPVGPVLPGAKQTSGVRQDPDVFGPSLPPGMKPSRNRLLGPALPPGMELPSGTLEKGSDDSDDEIVGPMLPEQLIQSNKNYLVHTQLERRAAEVKRKMEQKVEDVDITKREQWMLELPPEGTVDLGLGPRTFRMKGAPEKGADRSAWTDTPADKLRKQEQAITDAQNEGGSSSSRVAVNPPELSIRDKEMEKIVKKHSKKRGKESLLDMHQKDLNKKKKKEKEDGKKEERRPFSREVDLKTNVFDEAQKKSIFKKAQLLDTRFSRGETKYL